MDSKFYKRLCFFITLFSFGLSFSLMGQEHGKKKVNLNDQIKTIKKDIDKSNVEKMLRAFVAGSAPNRAPGSPGYEKAIQWIKNEVPSITEVAFSPDIDWAKGIYQKDLEQKVKPDHPQYLEYKKYTTEVLNLLESYRAAKGKNLIWRKSPIGSNSVDMKSAILVVAHFDAMAMSKKPLSLTPTAMAPGSDKNASGVVAAIHLIRALEKIDLKKEVVVVFTDMHELGYLGAKSLQLDPLIQNVEVVLNLVMLGQDTKFLDKTKSYYNYKLYLSKPNSPQAEKETALAKNFIDMGKKYANNPLKLALDQTGVELGDSYPFIEANIPVLTISSDGENDPNTKIHTADDFPETINFTSLTYAIEFIVSGIVPMLW